MQAESKRRLLDGLQYTKLIPKAKNEYEVIKSEADLKDTIKEIKVIVAETLDQTKDLAKILKGKDTYDTCKNIWNFIYKHIQYSLEEDEKLHEPARIWAERRKGVDCDDFSIMASSLLTNLKIDHLLRLGEYKNRGYFQHIYVIVPYDNEKGYITIDPVKDCFDCEEKFTNKKDIEMELARLSGIGRKPIIIDAEKVKEEITFIAENHDVEKNKQVVAVLDLLKSKGLDAKQILQLNEKLGFPNKSELDIDTAQKLMEIDGVGKEYKYYSPKFMSGDWWKKNGVVIGILGGAVVMAGVTAISFMGDDDKPKKETPQKVEGLKVSYKRKPKRKAKPKAKKVTIKGFPKKLK